MSMTDNDCNYNSYSAVTTLKLTVAVFDLYTLQQFYKIRFSSLFTTTEFRDDTKILPQLLEENESQNGLWCKANKCWNVSLKSSQNSINLQQQCSIPTDKTYPAKKKPYLEET